MGTTQNTTPISVKFRYLHRTFFEIIYFTLKSETAVQSEAKSRHRQSVSYNFLPELLNLDSEFTLLEKVAYLAKDHIGKS